MKRPEFQKHTKVQLNATVTPPKSLEPLRKVASRSSAAAGLSRGLRQLPNHVVARVDALRNRDGAAHSAR